MSEVKWPPEGVKWYYSDEWCAIANADCRDVLPKLPQVDLVITDPPYGIDYQSARRTGWQRKEKIVGDLEYPLWFFDLLKPSIALFVWCRWDILSQLPPPKSLIVWDKGNHSMGNLEHEFGRRWEACAFYPGPEHSFTKRPVDIIYSPRIPAEQLTHPNEKPVGAISPLIVCHPKNSVILDPFLGSGTTCFAAKQLGRRSIGIEIEERYAEIAARRLSQGVMRLEV